MLKKIGFGILLLLAAAGVYAALKPAEYSVYREVVTQAPPGKIFPFINNAREGGRWMPWAEIDPKMKMTYSGPEAGVGSKASWESPGRMGVGSSTISESNPNRSVKFDLDYAKPFPMKQTAEISITPSGDKNIVRWSVSGSNPFMGRLMCLFMSLFTSMDKMVGGSFEKGLANLKTLVER